MSALTNRQVTALSSAAAMLSTNAVILSLTTAYAEMVQGIDPAFTGLRTYYSRQFVQHLKASYITLDVEATIAQHT